MRRDVDRAVILAAGLGTRLKWLTQTRPKALMQVNGEAVIAHVIRSLVRQGVSDIAVNAHHHAGALTAYLGDGSQFGCSIRISHEPSLLDSGGGVKQALNYLPGDGLVAVYNADVLTDLNLQPLCRLVPAGGAALGLVNNPKHHPTGDFALSGTRVANSGDECFTFSGVSVWDEKVFDDYEQGAVFSLAHPMRELADQGLCHGLLHKGAWFDIGRPTDLMRANRFYR